MYTSSTLFVHCTYEILPSSWQGKVYQSKDKSRVTHRSAIWSRLSQRTPRPGRTDFAAGIDRGRGYVGDTRPTEFALRPWLPVLTIQACLARWTRWAWWARVESVAL